MTRESNNATNSLTQSDIRREPAIQNILSRMPEEIADQFTDDQLLHLKTAVGARQWGQHPVDKRGTFSIPGFKYKIYYVFLLGKNRRQLTKSEEKVSTAVGIAIASAIAFLLLSIIFIVLYILKSMAGINLFPEFSFGIWDYIKDFFR